jgi:hypothetical protein
MFTILQKSIGICVLSAALVAGYGAWHSHVKNLGYEEAAKDYTIAIDKMQLDASKKLASEIEKNKKIETSFNESKNRLEIKNVENQKIISSLSDGLRSATVNGRLRDPNSEGCRAGSSGSTGNNSTNASGDSIDNPEAVGLFSTGATELLQRITKEADEINSAYQICRSWAETVSRSGQ